MSAIPNGAAMRPIGVNAASSVSDPSKAPRTIIAIPVTRIRRRRSTGPDASDTRCSRMSPLPPAVPRGVIAGVDVHEPDHERDEAEQDDAGSKHSGDEGVDPFA